MERRGGSLNKEVAWRQEFGGTQGGSLNKEVEWRQWFFLLPSCRNRSCLFQPCDLEKESMVNQHTAGSTHQRNGHTPAGYGQNVRKP